MAKPRQPVENKRRIPHQTRATETVAAILEGAAQVLEAGGLAGFTTNAVAERAGVSIGTLYQYFADKNALLRTLAEREMSAALAAVAKALRGEADATKEGRVRAMVRAIVNAFHGRQRARKAVVQAVLAQGLSVEMMAPVAAFIAQSGSQAHPGLGAPRHRAGLRRLARPDGRDPRGGARGATLLQERGLRGRAGAARAVLPRQRPAAERLGARRTRVRDRS